jgi:hypothetical protein
LPTVPVPVPPVVPVLLGVAFVVPFGVIEPGIALGVVAGKPDLALEVADVEVFAVLVAEVTGLMVVEDGLTTAGLGVLAGVGFGVGGAGLAGVPGVDGTVDGLAGVVEIVPGVGAWARSKEAASDRDGSSMWSPGWVVST